MPKKQKTKNKKAVKKKKPAKAKKAKLSVAKKHGKPKTKPAKKAVSVKAKPVKEFIKEDDILKLIEKGRHRGFVTESEIMHAFPYIEKDIEGLERLYERLEASNINIIETGKVFEQERVKEHEEKKKLETE